MKDSLVQRKANQIYRCIVEPNYYINTLHILLYESFGTLFNTPIREKNLMANMSTEVRTTVFCSSDWGLIFAQGQKLVFNSEWT